MPEIKHNFTAGKMNKDLDERLVRNGEYRDALNIQVRTTDGDSDGVGDAGSVQNIKGNEKIGEAYRAVGYNDNETKIIASVSDEKNDCAYFFAAAPLPSQQLGAKKGVLENLEPSSIVDLTAEPSTSDVRWVDSIIQVNADGTDTEVVFVDYFGRTGQITNYITQENFNALNGSTTPFNSITFNESIARIGMRLFIQRTPSGGGITTNYLFDSNGTAGVEIININGNQVLFEFGQSIDFSTGDFNSNETQNIVVKLIHKERVLEFDYDSLISSSVNVVDDLLFYTDNRSEPKKINITRSKLGTTQDNYLTDPKHTKLFVKNAQGEFVNVTEVENYNDTTLSGSVDAHGDIEKEHVTVIRKKPTSPPTLEMSPSDREGPIEFDIQYPETILDSNNEDYQLGGFINYTENYVDFNESGYESDAEQSIFEIYSDDTVANVGSERVVKFPSQVDVRLNDILIFESIQYGFSNPVIVQATVEETDIATAVSDQFKWHRVKCTVIDPMLEQLNPDQWTVTIQQPAALFETKFGRFAYRYKYEDNEYSAFSPWSELAFLPDSFSYTPSTGHNEGMGNSVRRLKVRDFIPNNSYRPDDVRSIDILWKTTDDQNVYVVKTITRELDDEWEDFVDNNSIESTGSLSITSEMINRTLPANQLLRTWDNVPRFALAQEVTASRVVYANYVQGYDIDTVVGLKQAIISDPVGFPNPQRSVKSMRSYKWGMVFGDKYGRETPVLASSYKTSSGETITGTASTAKQLAAFSNKFELQQNWNSQPLPWMNYVKYYVKETSNEYYNLILDRWYDAGDGNIWLAFPSVDRNKVDEETYLILKNEHGSQAAVLDKARYKILAIENEAPDFIKLERRKFNRIEINRDNIYTASIGEEITGVPDKLINNSTLLSTNQDTNTIHRSDFKGRKKVRIVGVYTPDGSDEPFEVFSPYKPVTQIKNQDDGGCVVSERFTNEEVNMFLKLSSVLANAGIEAQINVTNVDDNTSDDYIYYYLEYMDEQINNLPEFDGRFFVKIQKDQTLRDRVLNEGPLDYTVVDTFDIAYISNNNTNPAVSGPQKDFTWPTDNAFPGSAVEAVVTAGNENHTADNYDVPGVYFDGIEVVAADQDAIPAFGPGDYVKTQTFWQDWNNNKSTNIFLDNAPAATGHEDQVGAYDLWIDGENQGDSNFGGLTGYYNGNLMPGYGGGLTPISYTTRNQIFGPESQKYMEFNSQHISNGGWGAPINPNYQPAGLSQGYASDGLFGQMTFSAVSDETVTTVTNDNGIVTLITNQFGPGTDIVFKSKIQQEGTLFRFAADPDQIVYRVLNNSQYITTYQESAPASAYDDEAAVDSYTAEGIHKHKGPINIGTQALGNNGSRLQWNYYKTSSVQNVGDDANSYDNEAGLRSSIIIRFARVDSVGQVITGSGIDVQRFDPRGEVTHDGLGSFQIQLVQRSSEGELSQDDVVTESSCWETEPKESADLDIYYEASPAVPMKLDMLNIMEFVGSNTNRKFASQVYIKPRMLNQVMQYINVDGDAFAFRTIGDDGVVVHSNFSINQNNNSISSSVISPSLSDNLNLISVGDAICFRRSSGFETKSKILDHYKIVYDFDSENGESLQLSDRYGPVSLPPNSNSLIDGDTTIQTFASFPFGAIDPSGDTDGGAILLYGAGTNVNTTVNLSTIDGQAIIMPGSGNDEANYPIKPGMNVVPSAGFEDMILPGTFVATTEAIQIGNSASANGSFLLVTLNNPIIGSFDDDTVLEITYTDVTGIFKIDDDVWQYPVKLPWFNCYSFGNGVESDRIRDDFNAPQIDNGCRVSSTFLEYGEERIGSGMIHSGLYNSTSSVNDLNEFNMAEKITKNLNPAYGSIQAMKTRENNIVTFTEDKILKVLANKDAVFNADGNPQLVATNRVLGDATPFAGDYGISKNPESLASDQYRLYFTDMQRGAVLRLSMDGLTPISNVGMKTYFRNNLKTCDNLIGTFDTVNGEYNLTLLRKPANASADSPYVTVSFNEGSKGWVSFKSFVPSTGVSISGKYLTAPSGYRWSQSTTDQQVSNVTHSVYEHYTSDTHNVFYGVAIAYAPSRIKILFNDLPSVVKSFKAVYYEGSQGRVEQNTLDTAEYYNISGNNGWQVTTFKTDIEVGQVNEFIKKEGKWFNYIKSFSDFPLLNTSSTTEDSGDLGKFAVQGLGSPLANTGDTQNQVNININTNTDG